MYTRRNHLGVLIYSTEPQGDPLAEDAPQEKPRPNYEAMIAYGSILGALASAIMVLRGAKR